MSKILNVTVQLRNGTAAEWADTSVAGKGANRVLAKGELGIEIDTRLFKIGNGTDAYKDLQYANDFDVNILGKNDKLNAESEIFLKSLIKDNPAGQSDELTPFILIKNCINHEV